MKKKENTGATIKDVARETHLAISTISKYMNGGSVREKNREKIEEAIRRLNYVPNSSARGLRTRKTYRVGVITGAVENPHTSAILSEVEKKLREKGYTMLFFSYDGSIKKAGQYIEYMIEMGMDGLLLTIPQSKAKHLTLPQNMQIPVVSMEENTIFLEGDCVQTSCTVGAYEIVEHLIRRGHRKIALIKGKEASMTAEERITGYYRVMEDYGIPVQKEFIVCGNYTYGGGCQAIKKLWGLHEKPTAVFISNYDMSMGAMEAVRDLEIRIPEELSIVTFDDFELSVLVRPKLTSVRQPLVKLADSACDLLIRRMNGDYSNYPQRIRLKPECIYRDSVRGIR